VVPWNEALKKSRDENKPIFLDLSASWCGYCKKLKRNTFSHSAAADYFNAKFINVEVDGENGEGLILAQKYGVSGYPSLFIIDKDGNII
jgi:thioredoxin 1